MSERKWTPEQQQAIDALWIDEERSRRANILVNAAAGSGKTAVLVERIIKKLIPGEDTEPTGIDRLLVVTFTNAAAAEMQERIADALSKRLAEAISEHDFKRQKLIKKQLSLLPFADITTIDAFCLKAIRNSFHLLNIDPDFSIMDSGELELMRADAAEELFERLYEENDKGFFNLLSMYTDGRDDAEVEDKIKQIYRFTRAFPNPKEWLEAKCDMYREENLESWLEPARREADVRIKRAYSKLCAAAELIFDNLPDEANAMSGNIEEKMINMPPLEENVAYLAWGTYYTAVFDELFRAKSMLDAEWDTLRELLEEPYIKLSAKALYTDRELQIKDKELKAAVKELRDSAKKNMEEAKGFVTEKKERLFEVMGEKLYDVAASLVRLTLEFDEIYLRMKRDKNVMEFSDVEHLCLKLFSEFPEVCAEYKKRYKEILMDEYQDTNRLQEEIFSKISTGDNLFMVGDMKQSIYRFRNSDPSIFKEKSDSYVKDAHAGNRKIILSKNFRSRGMVLESVNDVFELIMTERAAGVNYDEEQRLNTGDTSYEEKNKDYRSELMVIEEKGKSDELIIDKVTLEARAIARRILELRDSGFLVRDMGEVPVIDPETGAVKKERQRIWRDIKNKDIAILMSSYKGVSDIYTDELSKAGISCFAENDGYFERNEIKLITALLKVIGNPYQDIPLLGVLRSPIGGFSDDDLVNIRLSGEGYIYLAMKELADRLGKGGLGGDAESSAKKTSDFLEKLERWRGYAKYMPSDKLLWTLYEETEIYGFVGALYGREDAQANLRLLFERAKKYEKSGYKGLFNFVRYISLLKKKNEDLTSARMVAENHDVVRIMTIHKSKGLEFPVVFLAGAGKKFNLRDTSGNMLLHKDWGFGLEYIDFEKSLRMETLSKKIVANSIQEESIAEEIRKLYVAMTRAKEKLIVTATVSGKNKNDAGGVYDELEKWSGTQVMSAGEVLKCRSFVQWIGPAAVNNPEHWSVRPIEYGLAFDDAGSDESIQQEASGSLPDIDGLLSYRYPYENSADIPSKVSVSQLKSLRREPEETTALIRMPEFMKSEAAISGAARGTAMHYVMQKIPFAEVMDRDYVVQFIKELTGTGELTEAEAEAVDAAAIARFYNGELGKRMRGSRTILREQAFETAISASLVDDNFPDEETVILQGIIDCCFEEKEEWILVDYKSDHYTDLEEIKQKYTTQLQLYSNSIEKITKKKVKNKYLYLFFTDTVVEL